MKTPLKLRLIAALAVLTLCTCLSAASTNYSSYDDGSLSQEILSLTNSTRSSLSYMNSDLFGIGIPYNQLTLKLNAGNNAFLLQVSEVNNEIDLPYREKLGSLTIARTISNQLSLGAKVKLAQIDTVVTGQEYALDLGMGWTPHPRVQLAVSLDNLAAKKEYSTGTVEKETLAISGSVRIKLNPNLALLCTAGEAGTAVGLEQLLGNRLALFINAGNTKVQGGFNLTQKSLGFGYLIDVYPIGVQQTLTFSLGF